MTERVIGPTGSGRRRFAIVGAAVALVLILPTLVFASALPPDNIPGGTTNNALNAPRFEFDGNLLSDAVDPGTLDWAQGAVDTAVIPTAKATRDADGGCSGDATDPDNFVLGGPGVTGQGLLVCDGTISKQTPDDENAFVQGQHEDEGENPINWVVKKASSPKKTDLSEIYVYGKIIDSPFDSNLLADNLMFIFDTGRLDTNGDFHVDFELNQVAQTQCGDSDPDTVCQPRTLNDVIVSYDSAGGGQPPVATVFLWKTSLLQGQSCASSQGTINSPTLGGCYVSVAAPSSNGFSAAQGVFNSQEIDAATWKAVVCDPTSVESSQQCTIRSKIPAGGNMEGYIDIAGVIPNFNLCPGFGQVSAKSRSSSGINASLQDTSDALGIPASVCGSLIIKKQAKDASTPATGNELKGGFTFRISPNPITGSATPLDVADNGTNDAFDTTGGLVCIDNARFVTYTITEPGPSSTPPVTQPAGYKLDTSTTPTVTVSGSNTCAARGTNATPDRTFTNVPLSTIEVDFTSQATGANGGATSATIQCYAEDGTTALTRDTSRGSDNDDEFYADLDPSTTATAVYTCKVNVDP